MVILVNLNGITTWIPNTKVSLYSKICQHKQIREKFNSVFETNMQTDNLPLKGENPTVPLELSNQLNISYM